MLTQTCSKLPFTREEAHAAEASAFLPVLSPDSSIQQQWHRSCGIKADALHEETAAGIDCVLQPLQGVNTHRVIHKSYRWIIPFLFLTVSYPYP